MKKKACVIGVGGSYNYRKKNIYKYYDILGLFDNSEAKVGTEIDGKIVNDLSHITDFEYDNIIITPTDYMAIINQLLDKGIERKKMILFNEIIDKAYDEGKLSIGVIFYGGMGDLLIGKNWLFHLVSQYALADCHITAYVHKNMVDTADELLVDGKVIHSVIEFEDNYFDELKKKEDVIFKFCIVPNVVYFEYDKLYLLKDRFCDYIIKLKQYGLKNYNLGFCDSENFYKTVRKIFDSNPKKKYYSFCDVLDDLKVTEEFGISLDTGLDEDDYLAKVGLKNQKFITLDTGLNMIHQGKGNTRAWAHEKWDELSKMIHNKFPEIKIVQVGARLLEQDDIFADVHLNGKTNLKEIIVLMKKSFLHIDYDGGLTHIRHIVKGGPSIVLFGSSGIEQHLYTENICLRTETCEKACEWSDYDWLFICPKGDLIPRCMDSLSPQMVFDEVKKFC